MNTPQTPPQDSPIADFSNCHAGILNKLSVLNELPALAEAAARARAGAQDVLDFFDTVMHEHHEEEERELFPAVFAVASPQERVRLADLAAALTQEHRELESLWKNIRPALKQVAKGQPVQVPVAAMNELVQRYGAHARLEEKEYLPLAHDILSRRGGSADALALALHIRHRPPIVGHV